MAASPRWRAVPALVTALAVAGACSSFTGSGEDVAAPDAADGADAADAGDAGTTQGGDAADGARPAFCDDAGWVCDDFDDPPDGWPVPVWGNPGPLSDVTIVLTDAATPRPPSPPNAALFRIDPSDAAGVTAFLSSAVSGPMSGLHCTFDIDVAATGPEGIDLMQIRLNAGDLQFALATNGFAAYGQFSIIAPLPTNKWTSVVLDVVFGKSVRLSFNGGEQLTSFDAGGPGYAVTGAALSLGAAHSGVDPAATTSILYDNVRCDALP